MTKAERDEIRARADAATKGPWVENSAYESMVSATELWTDEQGEARDEPLIVDLDRRGPNREFVRHARADIPALLGDLDAQDAEVARLTVENDRLIVIAKADEWQARYWAEHNAVADREATIMAERENSAAMRQKASALAEAMETCHVCHGTVIVGDGPTYCEHCSSDCDSHAEPECVGLDVLHLELQLLLQLPDAGAKLLAERALGGEGK